ncbi:hypothetical protein BP5796_11986 [Coleophoma crateriformis]|uniref:C3H1-type domain-containing protein n=1 Tax=Coleophoma crateriformis TaxID=565419 RepID=A0A3D8QB40_9HELO|nr:hypothetical protein BP5796_11986 [Coleophoma crateriformis]
MRTAKPSGFCFQYAESGACRFGSQCKYTHEESNKDQNNKALQSVPRNLTQSRKKPKGKGQEIKRPTDHIGDFFAQHPPFRHDSSAPIWSEFYRMCDDFDWGRHDPEMLEAKREFKSAMVLQFNGIYGKSERNMRSWKKLYRALNITPVPMDLNACRKIISKTHVNLVDLVDAPRTGASVMIFPSLTELQDYTIESGKFFPKSHAYAGGLLRLLLREILNARESLP